MLDFKIKFMDSGLSKDQMIEKERANANEISLKILQNLKSEAEYQTKNKSLKTINEFSFLNLSNFKIVDFIHQKVKAEVNDKNKPAATHSHHIGVKYVIDYHGLIS